MVAEEGFMGEDAYCGNHKHGYAMKSPTWPPSPISSQVPEFSWSSLNAADPPLLQDPWPQLAWL